MSAAKSMISLPMAVDKVDGRKLFPFFPEFIMDQRALIIVLRTFSATSLDNNIITYHFLIWKEDCA